jgi:hypothetical protein
MNVVNATDISFLFEMLRFKPTALDMLGKHSTTKLHPQPLGFLETGSHYVTKDFL